MNRWRAARRAAGRIGLGRAVTVCAMLAAAVLIARHTWSVPLAQDAERAIYDVRAMIAAARVDEDPRLIEVVYTDDTLEKTGRRSPLDRGLLARALTRLDGMGAKAIAIDMLIDEPQPEDPQLIAAFRAMRTPTYLGFATNATNGDAMAVWQERFERHLFGQLIGSNVHPASIKVETDWEDGAARSWPRPDPTLPPTLVDRLLGGPGAFRGYDRSLVFRLPKYTDREVFGARPIELFDNDLAAQFLRPSIAGKFVLVGGKITDVDQFETPLSRFVGRPTFGLDIHATMLAQRLDGVRLARVPRALLWLAALVVVVAAAAVGVSELARWRLALALAASLAIIVLLPVGLQMLRVDTQGLPAFGWLVGWTLAYVAAAAAARGLGSEQRRFAQGALGRYLPPDIVAEILKDPEQLRLHGERVTIFALFSDMEGFTKLTHAIEPEMLSLLLNRYLDVLSNVVLAHGGTIDKFVGDAVVAFWGAPIARADDGDRALAAAIAMVEAGEAFRREAPPGVPPIGRTRVGLHRGEAVIGNFGGEGRIQYTALGDAMNAAARMEGANKALSTRALVSAEAAAEMTDPPLRPMGRVALRGRASPIAVLEPMPELPRDEIATLRALIDRFDGGDVAALEEMDRYAGARSDDIAVAKLVARLRIVGPGGYLALD